MPDQSPHFFVDRSLGRNRVPQRLRAEGWSLTTLAEHYGIPQDERVSDVDWLQLAGSRRWPVLMKDARIRYRPAERDALTTFSVCAFCLGAGNLTAAEMSDLFVRQRQAIWQLGSAGGSGLHILTNRGLRTIGM